ncbi:MAG: amidohydrolase family protein [Myxococcaceae bacterium]|nr:amidohydrolase family protein [Myxococcaceae bacterium]
MQAPRHLLARLLTLVLPLVVTAAHAEDAPASPRRVAVRAARLVDGRGGAPLTDAVVLIEGERITAVGQRLKIPADAQVIDLGKATLLPGFIDAHTHITSQPGNYYEDMFRKSPIDYAVVAHLYARRTLEAGFTTARDVGAGEFIDVSLRNAIDSGTLPGPRLQVAGLGIGATGGHADNTGFSPYLKFGQFSGVADGVDELRKMVRFNVKSGANLIKVMAGAGVLSEEESVGAPQYSEEELKALVQEAAMWDRKVAAHAHGAEAIKRALRAGVASVEHASFIDDEGIRLAKERGAYLVMDVYNDDYIMAEFKRLGYPAKILAKEALVGRTQRENFRKAVRAGVKLAYGTDAGVYPHGWNAKQFAKMVEWGMTPMQAIQAATVHAADLLGWSDRVGSVQPGRFADLVAVEGDPLRDVRELEKVTFVMKGGEVFKRTAPAAAGVASASGAAQ